MIFDLNRRPKTKVEDYRKDAARRRRKRGLQQFLLALVGLILFAAVIWLAVFVSDTLEQLSADLYAPDRFCSYITGGIIR